MRKKQLIELPTWKTSRSETLRFVHRKSIIKVSIIPLHYRIIIQFSSEGKFQINITNKRVQDSQGPTISNYGPILPRNQMQRLDATLQRTDWRVMLQHKDIFIRKGNR